MNGTDFLIETAQATVRENERLITENAALLRRTERAEAAAEALADALEYVEFDVDGYCCWCEGWEDEGGHADTCQRQAALRQYRGVKE